MWKSLNLNKREGEKRFRRIIYCQRLTLNHPSLMDEEEKTKVYGTAHRREIVVVSNSWGI